LIEEAGGVVSDSRGHSLDFGLGRTLGKNHGIVACSKYVHPKVLDAIRVALKESRKRVKSHETLKSSTDPAQSDHPPPYTAFPDDEKENRPAEDSKL
jgi:3'(2'), 5'-bisphosphate nucleotidase